DRGLRPRAARRRDRRAAAHARAARPAPPRDAAGLGRGAPVAPARAPAARGGVVRRRRPRGRPRHGRRDAVRPARAVQAGRGDVDAGGGLRRHRDRAARRPAARCPCPRGGRVTALGPLARTLEALLFLSPEPVAVVDLAQAADCWPDEAEAALAELGEACAPGARGLVLRELAGGWTLATAPEAEPAARRLLARPRTPPLTPA